MVTRSHALDSSFPFLSFELSPLFGLAQGVLKKVLTAMGLLRVMRSLKNEASP
jgi:hypothetical protein